MFLISSTLVLLEPHCYFWQTGVASLFVMLQWADFLAGARACSSWALPRPGLQKKHFSILRLFFPPKDSHPVMHNGIYHITCDYGAKACGCLAQHGANWHTSSLVCAIELCTLLKTDSVPFAPWNGPVGSLGRQELTGSWTGIGTALQREILASELCDWGCPLFHLLWTQPVAIVQTQPISQEAG